MIRRAVSALVLVGLVVAFGATSATGVPIRAHQHFVGVVKTPTPSASAIPILHTVCPGPSRPGQTGPLVSGPTLSVRSAAAGPGYTGVFNRIHAWFDQDASAGGPVEVTFARYGVEKPIPRAVRVPCDGLGTVTFSSCPRLAPCAAGWVPVSVTVQFENIAV